MSGSHQYDGILHLFTTRFPYGISEPFLENEIPYLAAFFNEVRIYPMFKDEGCRRLPSGVHVIDLFEDPYRSASYGQMLQNFGLFSGILKAEKKRTKGSVKNEDWAEIRSSLRQNLQRALVLKDQLKGHGKMDVFYSYWTFDWATVLTMLVKMNFISGFVSRVHGFDLYEERNEKGIIPFRSLQLSGAEKVVAVSKEGLNYLKGNYPENSPKFHLSHLGVQDHGIAPVPSSEIPHIVSCSNVIPLKRVELILEVLKAWDRAVLWTHFGGGKGLVELRSSVATLPDHIEVDLRGAVENSEVLEQYKKKQVDLFIHLSSSEGGVPVAMQEAASFGIPMIGTAVGGVPEICTEETGVLLVQNPKIEEIVSALDGFCSGTTNSPEFRSQVRSYWEANFKAESIFPKFCELLVSDRTNTILDPHT